MSSISKLLAFPKESWAELKKVHTPTRQETTMITIRVFVLIAIFAVFLGITDFLIGKLMQNLLTS